MDTREVRDVMANIQVENLMFNNELLTEWDLSKKRFYVILGKPWFEKYNPQIDWRTNKIIKVDEHPAEGAWMIKVNVIESKPK